jgi:hypothetical protein
MKALKFDPLVVVNKKSHVITPANQECFSTPLTQHQQRVGPLFE